MRLKAPTVSEQKWLSDIVRIGCIVCVLEGRGLSVAEVHHMLEGGRKLGHMWTIPLCMSHHRAGLNNKQIVSRDHNQRRFEARYGTERELHAATALLVAKMKELQV